MINTIELSPEIPFTVDIGLLPLDDLKNRGNVTTGLRLRIEFFNNKDKLYVLQRASVEIVGAGSIQHRGDEIDSRQYSNNSYLSLNYSSEKISRRSRRFLGVEFHQVEESFYNENESIITVSFEFCRVHEEKTRSVILVFDKNKKNEYFLIEQYLETDIDEHDGEEKPKKVMMAELSLINQVLNSNAEIINNGFKNTKISSLKCTGFINAYGDLEYKVFVEAVQVKKGEKEFFIRVSMFNEEDFTIAECSKLFSSWNNVESFEINFRPELGLGVAKKIQAHLLAT